MVIAQCLEIAALAAVCIVTRDLFVGFTASAMEEMIISCDGL